MGYNSRVTFTAEDAGTYYVAAGAVGTAERGEGTYTLSVEEVMNDDSGAGLNSRVTFVDDFAAGTGTNGAVEVGESVTGDIEVSGDRDWFAVELDAGSTYRIDLEGSRTSAGTLSDPYLRGIHDADGVRLAGTTNDDGGAGLNSRVTFTATEDGTHYVAAGAWGTREGTYTLSVEEVL